MRPHTRVLPLLVVFVAVVAVVLMLPVDVNAARCRETPEHPACDAPPVFEPWIVHWAKGR
jgi:hypothetical protein